MPQAAFMVLYLCSVFTDSVLVHQHTFAVIPGNLQLNFAQYFWEKRMTVTMGESSTCWYPACHCIQMKLVTDVMVVNDCFILHAWTSMVVFSSVKLVHLIGDENFLNFLPCQFAFMVFLIWQDNLIKVSILIKCQHFMITWYSVSCFFGSSQGASGQCCFQKFSGSCFVYAT